MVHDKDSVQLAEYCFDVCEALKTATQGKNADDLGESVRTALEDSERCVHWASILSVSILNNLRVTSEIEQTLREGENTPYIKHKKSKRYKLEVQAILATLNAPSSNAGEHAPRLAPVYSRDTVTTFVSESSMSPAPPPPITVRSTDRPPPLP
jgi:hypothetical protein